MCLQPLEARPIPPSSFIKSQGTYFFTSPQLGPGVIYPHTLETSKLASHLQTLPRVKEPTPLQAFPRAKEQTTSTTWR